MVVIVPIEEPAGFPNYGREDYGILDEVGDEVWRFGAVSRSASQTASVQTTTSFGNGFDVDGGFGFKSTGRRKGHSMTPMRVGRGDGEAELYAEYLRSSSSTESSRGGQIKARDRSESKMRVRNDSVVAEIRERDGVGTARRKDNSAADARLELQRRRNGMLTESLVQMPMRGLSDSSPIPDT